MELRRRTRGELLVKIRATPNTHSISRVPSLSDQNEMHV